MSMLARYKKAGGIIELVKLIEEAVEPKRSQLLAMVRNEDPEFAARVEGRIFTYEMFKTLPENLVAEIVSATPAKILALSLYGENDIQWVALVEKCVGNAFADYKSEKEMAVAQPPNAAQVDAARKKMVSEARKLESEGKIKLPFHEADPNKINAGKIAMPSSSGGAPAAMGTASENDGCPPIESFGLEPAPPGLSGERLETYLKQQLEK